MARHGALWAALVALLLTIFVFEQHGELALAAFGRRSKLKLKRKAPLPPEKDDRDDELPATASAPVTAAPPRRMPSLKAATLKAPVDLEEELEMLAEALPSKDDKHKKINIWEMLQMICEDALDDDVKVWPFGSSANGCGEATSDLDMVVSDVLKPKKREAVSALRKIADMCKWHGFVVEELRPRAKVPILMLRKDGIDVDISCGNMLPLLNTRLLRSYTLLNPRLSVVALAVKRWAKAVGIAKTFDGFISSYAWTLMVVYYMQIEDQLPSLHRLMEEKYAGMGYVAPKTYAWDFLTIDLGKEMWRGPSGTMSCGELLQGFFRFYATDFEWQREVISVRRGQRCFRPNHCYPHLAATHGSDLNIEDPIDMHRNLNFALKKYKATSDIIRSEIDTAHDRLSQGLGLTALDVQLPAAQRRGASVWMQRIQENFLELPADPANSVMTLCGKCGKSMSLAALLDHGSCGAKVVKLRGDSKFDFCCKFCLKCFCHPEDLEQHQNATGHGGRLTRLQAIAKLAESGPEDMPLRGTRRRK